MGNYRYINGGTIRRGFTEAFKRYQHRFIVGSSEIIYLTVLVGV